VGARRATAPRPALLRVPSDFHIGGTGRALPLVDMRPACPYSERGSKHFGAGIPADEEVCAGTGGWHCRPPLWDYERLARAVGSACASAVLLGRSSESAGRTQFAAFSRSSPAS